MDLDRPRRTRPAVWLLCIVTAAVAAGLLVLGSAGRQNGAATISPNSSQPSTTPPVTTMPDVIPTPPVHRDPWPFEGKWIVTTTSDEQTTREVVVTFNSQSPSADGVIDVSDDTCDSDNVYVSYNDGILQAVPAGSDEQQEPLVACPSPPPAAPARTQVVECLTHGCVVAEASDDQLRLSDQVSGDVIMLQRPAGAD